MFVFVQLPGFCFIVNIMDEVLFLFMYFELKPMLSLSLVKKKVSDGFVVLFGRLYKMLESFQ